MEIYAASDNVHIRYFIADNTGSPVAILSKLAADKERMIRQMVANNLSTPPEIIEQLAKEGIEQHDLPF